MKPEDLMRLIDELWPKNDMAARVLAELARRVCSWPPMNYEMAEAALTEYAINSPKYEKRTPDAGSLQRVLRNAAYPPSSAKPSPGSSEYQPEERHGVSFAEWVKQEAAWIEREKARACDCDKGVPGTIGQPCLRCGGSFAGKWMLRSPSTASIGAIGKGTSK